MSTCWHEEMLAMASVLFLSRYTLFTCLAWAVLIIDIFLGRHKWPHVYTSTTLSLHIYISFYMVIAYFVTVNKKFCNWFFYVIYPSLSQPKSPGTLATVNLVFYLLLLCHFTWHTYFCPFLWCCSPICISSHLWCLLQQIII